MNERKNPFKDTLLYGAIIATIVWIVFPAINRGIQGQPVDIPSIIRDIVIIVTGVVGIFELFRVSGLTVFVPTSYINAKEKGNRKQIELTIEEYFENEERLLSNYQNEKDKQLLARLGLKKEEVKAVVNFKREQAKNRNIPDIETAKTKLEGLIFASPEYIVDVANSTLANNEERYYIKLQDMMHEESLRRSIISIMTKFIKQILDKKTLDEIEACVIPHSSNYLLGFETSKELCKKFVKMIDRNKVISNQAYEGSLAENSKVIIIHDTLFRGKQVYESIDHLREVVDGVDIVGVFCLVYRNAGGGKKEIELRDISVYPLIEWSEYDIEMKLNK